MASDYGVVLAIDEEDRRAVPGDVLLDGERVAHSLIVLSAFSQQSPSGTLVCTGVRHAHHRIYGSNEGGSIIMNCEL